MSLFYSHQRVGEAYFTDDEGTDYRNFEAAYAAAVAGARDLMCAEVRQGHLSLDQSLELHDALGGHLATIKFADALRISFPKQLPPQ
ncbi:MAG: hypothetical protein JWN59_1347 [Sphingomonas bacterium]|nr:hypothetical protein [Sphingomonas bacterium]